jgi:hypothetical protein
MESLVIILYPVYFVTTLEIHKKGISSVLLPDMEENLPKGRNSRDALQNSYRARQRIRILSSSPNMEVLGQNST